MPPSTQHTTILINFQSITSYVEVFQNNCTREKDCFLLVAEKLLHSVFFNEGEGNVGGKFNNS